MAQKPVKVGGAAMSATKNSIENAVNSKDHTTLAGGKLLAMMSGKDVVVKDEKGNTSKITIMGVNQSNGVIHVIDSGVLPK